MAIGLQEARSRLAFLSLFTAMALSCSQDRTPDSDAQETAAPVAGVVTLEQSPDCLGCEIVLEEVSILGDAQDSLPIGDGSTLVLLPGGDCIVGPTDRDGELLRFKQCRGQPELFGRIGQGPGELSSIRAIAGWRGDSVLVFGYGSMVVVSGSSGAGRTTRFDPAIQGERILTFPTNSQIVVNSGSSVGPQFIVLRSDGSIALQSGVQAETGVRTDPQLRDRVIGASPSPSRFWDGAGFYRYQMELLDDSGQQVRSFARSPSWFPSYDSVALNRFWAASGATVRPLPYLRAIRETSGGLLWATFAVPARGWQPDSIAPKMKRTQKGELAAKSQTRLAHYDGVLEVVEAESGAVLVTIQTPDMWAGFSNDTLLYARRSAPDGTAQIALYRFSLRR